MSASATDDDISQMAADLMLHVKMVGDQAQEIKRLRAASQELIDQWDTDHPGRITSGSIRQETIDRLRAALR